MFKKTLSTAILATLATASAQTFAQTSEQTAQPQAPTPAPQAPAMTHETAPAVDKQEVKKFVAAYTDVQEVRQDYSQQLQGVQDAEKAKDLQQKAQEKMDDAVESNGLTVDEYRELANQINQDPELLAMVQDELIKASN